MEHETPRDVWRRWEADQAAAIIDSINQVREARGFSLRRLAELLEGVGWPIGFGTLAGILSTKKRAGFTVAEVFAFARALSVPPGYLMLGLPSGAVPGQPVLPRDFTTGELLAWFTGGVAAPDLLAVGAGEVPDDVTSAAVMALRDAAFLADLIEEAREQNDILIAARAFRTGEVAAVLGERWADGHMLRSTLENIRYLLIHDGAGVPPLRPPLPAPPAPFDVVLLDDVSFAGVELPLPVPEAHDVSRVEAYIRDLLLQRRRRVVKDV